MIACHLFDDIQVYPERSHQSTLVPAFLNGGKWNQNDGQKNLQAGKNNCRWKLQENMVKLLVIRQIDIRGIESTPVASAVDREIIQPGAGQKVYRHRRWYLGELHAHHRLHVARVANDLN